MKKISVKVMVFVFLTGQLFAELQPLVYDVIGKRGSADQRYVLNKAGDVEMLSTKDLKQTGTLPDRLGQLRGIDVQNLGIAGKEQLVIHGYSDKTGLLVIQDGVKQNDINNDAILWQAFPLFDIEQVDMLRGGHSVIYGGGAVGGVLVMKSSEIKEGFHAKLQMGNDQFGKRRDALRLTNQFVSGMGIDLAQSQVSGRGFRDNSGENVQLSQLKLSQGEWRYLLRFATAESQIPGELTTTDALINPRKSNKSPDNLYRETLVEHQIQFQKEYAKGQLYHQERTQRSKLFTDAFANMTRKGGSWQWSGFARVLGNHQWIAGLEGDQANIESGYASSPTGSLLAGTIAGFVSDQWHWGSVLWDFGCRFDRVDYQYQNLLTVWPTYESGSRFFERLSPGLGVTLFPDDNVSLFMNASRAFKVPPFEDFAVFSPSYNANPKIGPQISDSLEAGIRGQGLISWQLSGYQSTIQDEILYNDTLGSNENVNTIHQGASARLAWRVGSLSIDGSVVRDRGWITQGTSDSLLSGRLLPNIPDWVAKLQLSYEWSDTLQFDLRCRYQGEQAPINDYAQRQKQPGFGVWDMGLSWQNEGWLAQVDLKNLADVRYDEYVAVNWSGNLDVYPAQGRTLVGRITCAF